MEYSSVAFITFVIVSSGIVILSRKSLFDVRTHGFYRFFAWEFILVLILLNIPSWFDDPASTRQIISWSLLTGSLYLVWEGVRQFRRMGRSHEQRNDPSLLTFEKTTTLVTTGIYRYIRHPMYASLLFLAWGAFLKDITWYSASATASATICLVMTAKMDERECIRYFGHSYEEYMKHSKMFLPFLL
jgi:protein-S-isoprenylcysteine O-methyltransferase Ste14